MEKDLENSKSAQRKDNFLDTQLSSFAYDSVKRTLYCTTGQPTDLETLKDGSKVAEVVQFQIGLPQKEATQIADSIVEDTKENIDQEQVNGNQKDEESAKFCVPETLRFSRGLSDQDISPSGLTAVCKSKDTEKFSLYYSNITFKRGIHYWEIICPISCSGIEFGVKNKETNEVIWVAFRTTTSRIVGMRLDLESCSLNFWLNGRSQLKRNQSIGKGEYYLLIKMKNYGNTVILNPFAQLNQENIYLPQTLVLSAAEKNLILNAYGDSVDRKSRPASKKKVISQIEPKESPTEPPTELTPDDVPEEGKAQSIKMFDDKQSQNNAKEEQKNQNTKSSKSEMEFAQNYQNLLRIYESVKSSSGSDNFSPASTLKWKTIDYTDKVLWVDGERLKVNTRAEDGLFDISPALLMSEQHEGKVKLLLTKEDTLSMITLTNWKALFAQVTNSDEKECIEHFLQAVEASKSYRFIGKVTVVIEIELIVAKVAINTLLQSATHAFNSIREVFMKMRKEAILKGVSIQLDSVLTSIEIRDDYFFVQNPSVVNILKLFAVVLSLQEQVWLATKVDTSWIDPAVIERVTSRTQTAYGRLASFVSWPSDQLHPVKLSEAGLVNTSDQLIKLNHYLEYGTPIEEDVLKWVETEGKNLTHYLQTRFPNNLMIKGYPAINVPLYKTINYHPPWMHTSNVGNEEHDFTPKEITDICTPKFSEFLMSANSEDGSVCIWNSQLHLFLVGRLNFK